MFVQPHLAGLQVGMSAARLYSPGADMEDAGAKQKDRVDKKALYASPEMREVFKSFQELDVHFKLQEKAHPKLRDELIGRKSATE